MEELGDERGRVVEQFEVLFEEVQMRGGRGLRGPEERVVVGEEGEEDAEEEGGCCGRKALGWDGMGWIERGNRRVCPGRVRGEGV